MTRRSSALLVLNAALALVVTCFVGIPYGEARKEEAGQETWFDVAGTASQWRLAHAEGLMNAIVVIALAAALARITMSRRSETVVRWSLIALVWGNLIGAVTAALGSDDSFSTDLITDNPISMLFYSAAAVGAFVGFVEVARSAWREAQRPEVDVRSEERASAG